MRSAIASPTEGALPLQRIQGGIERVVTDRRVVGGGFGRRMSSDGELGAFYRSLKRQEVYQCALPKWRGISRDRDYKKHRDI